MGRRQQRLGLGDFGQDVQTWAPVEGLSRTVGDEHAEVVGLIDTELARLWSVNTVALSEREGKVREAICNVGDGFLVEQFSDALGPSAGDSSEQAQVLFVK